jgi:hypothetical protein
MAHRLFNKAVQRGRSNARTKLANFFGILLRQILTQGDHPLCSSHRRRVSLTVETK